MDFVYLHGATHCQLRVFKGIELSQLDSWGVSEQKSNRRKIHKWAKKNSTPPKLSDFFPKVLLHFVVVRYYLCSKILVPFDFEFLFQNTGAICIMARLRDPTGTSINKLEEHLLQTELGWQIKANGTSVLKQNRGSPPRGCGSRHDLGVIFDFEHFPEISRPVIRIFQLSSQGLFSRNLSILGWILPAFCLGFVPRRECFRL